MLQQRRIYLAFSASCNRTICDYALSYTVPQWLRDTTTIFTTTWDLVDSPKHSKSIDVGGFTKSSTMSTVRAIGTKPSTVEAKGYARPTESTTMRHLHLLQR